MPKVLTFLPCEKVIIDKETNAISILAVLQDINIPAPPVGLEIPKGAVAPFNWAIFTMISKEPRDPDEFEQLCVLNGPRGEELMAAPIHRFKFEVPAKPSRNIVRIQVMPVHTEGQCSLILKLRKVGEAKWATVAEYPMGFLHIRT